MYVFIYMCIHVLGLSCDPIKTTSYTRVTPTENWMYGSFAKFEVIDKAMSLDGPEITQCIASKTFTYWNEMRPAITGEDPFIIIPAIPCDFWHRRRIDMWESIID